MDQVSSIADALDRFNSNSKWLEEDLSDSAINEWKGHDALSSRINLLVIDSKIDIFYFSSSSVEKRQAALQKQKIKSMLCLAVGDIKRLIKGFGENYILVIKVLNETAQRVTIKLHKNHIWFFSPLLIIYIGQQI